MKSEQQAKLDEMIKKAFDDLIDTTKQFRAYDKAHVNETWEELHKRLLFVSSVENDLSHLYRTAATLKYSVEVGLNKAKSLLEDRRTEVMQRPNFKGPMSYMSAQEVDAKARSLTIEEVMDLREWEDLNLGVKVLVDTIRSYQSDAGRERRDIDTRYKLLSMF